MALLSIIVPIYNKASFVDECLLSILCQSLDDFELILVNDGSTDGSLTKCQEYQKNDKRVRIIDQPNQGVSSARNAGLDSAKGLFVGFVDADDTIEQDMYELLVNNALKFNADISVCRVRMIFAEKTLSPNEKCGPVVLTRDDAFEACLRGDFDRSANNKIYKREVVRDIRFEGRYNEDILYTCMAFIASKLVVCENLVKYNYLVRENSTSMSAFNSSYFDILDVSTKIVALASSESAKSLPEAMNFDVVANISMLNLLLLTKKAEDSKRYQQVVSKLASYSSFIFQSNLIRPKHKYAYKLFLFSPKIYTSLMYIYCLVTQKEVIKRVTGN